MNEDAHRLQALNIKDRRTGTIAGAFDDKIVVSRRVADLAARSPLNALFGHVEYDEDIDRTKIHQMEQEIITAMRHLPQSGQGLTERCACANSAATGATPWACTRRRAPRSRSTTARPPGTAIRA